MPIRIEKISSPRCEAVARFSARLFERGVHRDFQLPARIPLASDAPVTMDCYIALDGDEVRGGYLAEWQDFQVAGEILRLGGYQLPISEGIVDRRYTSVALLLMQHSVTLHPYWFTVGMGGIDLPLPRMLKTAGWHVALVPFLFRVKHAGAFCRNIRPLRTSGARRLGLDLLAATGLGSIAFRAIQWRSLRSPGREWVVDSPPAFEGWADDLWKRARSLHSICAVRDSRVLRHLYPGGGPYRCLRVRRGGETVAWAVLCLSRFTDNPYFGDMRVGIILDCFGLPGAAAALAFHTARALEHAGADVCITNQSADLWIDAFKACGFVSGPSNYGMSLSKQVVAKLAESPRWQASIHLTRGDGDGRVNLLRHQLSGNA